MEPAVVPSSGEREPDSARAATKPQSRRIIRSKINGLNSAHFFLDNRTIVLYKGIMKYFKKQGKRVILEAVNSQYLIIRPEAELKSRMRCDSGDPEGSSGTIFKIFRHFADKNFKGVKSMNTMEIIPVRVATSIAIRQPRLVHYKIAAQKSLFRRFQHFIESTDWEERYLCNPWIDKICLCVIVASMIYFLPLLMSVIQK